MAQTLRTSLNDGNNMSACFRLVLGVPDGTQVSALSLLSLHPQLDDSSGESELPRG
jgi:hypothetical protein